MFGCLQEHSKSFNNKIFNNTIKINSKNARQKFQCSQNGFLTPFARICPSKKMFASGK